MQMSKIPFDSEHSRRGVSSEFPKWKYDVLGGNTAKIPLTEQNSEVGVLLNRHFQDTPSTSWVRVSLDEKEKGYLNVDLLNPELISRGMGRSALIDTVRIEEGDQYVIGRKKYPELGGYVSERHIALTVNEESQGVQWLGVQDMHSTNGTGIYIPISPTQDRRSGYRRHDAPTQPENGRADDEPQNHKLFAFIDRHKETHEHIGDVDWAIGFNVIIDLRSRYATDRKILERQFNRVMHPDRRIISDPQAAHDMYLIGKKELGL
jgi:hypothetical protein